MAEHSGTIEIIVKRDGSNTGDYHLLHVEDNPALIADFHDYAENLEELFEEFLTEGKATYDWKAFSSNYSE